MDLLRSHGGRRAARSCSAATSSRRSSGSPTASWSSWPVASPHRATSARIRRLMIDRPHRFTLRSSDDRRLARELLALPEVEAVELRDGAPQRAHRRLRRVDARRRAGRAAGRRVAPRAASRGRVARVGLQLPGAPMIVTLARLTFRALLNRRRTLLLGLLGALIVVVALIYRLGEPGDARVARRSRGRLLGRLRRRRAPAARGGDRRHRRARVGARRRHRSSTCSPSRCRAGASCSSSSSWRGLVSALLVVPADPAGRAHRPPVAIPSWQSATRRPPLLGALEYTAVFLALSLVTSRALIIGLAYVVVWEGVVAGLFAGTRILSIRQHALAVADARRWRGRGRRPSSAAGDRRRRRRTSSSSLRSRSRCGASSGSSCAARRPSATSDHGSAAPVGTSVGGPARRARHRLPGAHRQPARRPAPPAAVRVHAARL